MVDASSTVATTLAISLSINSFLENRAASMRESFLQPISKEVGGSL
jgi:hypothetical protein